MCEPSLSAPGVVTWVDNLYLARDILEAHLWGWAQVGGGTHGWVAAVGLATCLRYLVL